jgi:dTMP kinase
MGLHARAGRLVTLEGVEGAGKTTQMARLGAWLRRRGLVVSETAEPDGTPLGARMRELLGALAPVDPLAECLLFVAARAEHVRRVIRPALDRGHTVLCDRYEDSTIAYQGYGRGVELETVAALNRLATDGIRPALTIVLDLDVAEGLRRVAGRREGAVAVPVRDPFERLGLDFHERVRKGYRALHEQEPERVVLVAAARPEDAVAAEVQALVASRLGLEAAP